MLHHIGIEKLTVLKNLIIKLQNKAKFVLIKDHFQYGYISNLTLRVMDFLGNYFNLLLVLLFIIAFGISLKKFI